MTATGPAMTLQLIDRDKVMEPHRDTWACTERWTSRPARPATVGEGTAETPETPGEQATDTEAARPVPVYDWPLTRHPQVTRG